MPHINAKLTLHEEEDFRYWESKPMERYEIEYYTDDPNETKTLYNASLRNLFKKFFQKTGKFEVSYTLEVPSTVDEERKKRILTKFNTEQNNFTRKLLNLKKEDALPTGEALTAALASAFLKRKAEYKLFLEKQLSEVNQSSRKLHLFFGGLGLVSILGIGALLIGIAASAFPLAPIMAPIMLLSLLAVGSIGFYLFVSVLHKNYLKNTTKTIQDLAVPSHIPSAKPISVSPSPTADLTPHPLTTPLASEPESKPSSPPTPSSGGPSSRT